MAYAFLKLAVFLFDVLGCFLEYALLDFEMFELMPEMILWPFEMFSGSFENCASAGYELRMCANIRIELTAKGGILRMLFGRFMELYHRDSEKQRFHSIRKEIC